MFEGGKRISDWYVLRRCIWSKNIKEIQNFGFRVAFQMGTNLKNILWENIESLIPNSYHGVYELKCSCGWVQYVMIKQKRKSLIGQ